MGIPPARPTARPQPSHLALDTDSGHFPENTSHHPRMSTAAIFSCFFFIFLQPWFNWIVINIDPHCVVLPPNLDQMIDMLIDIVCERNLFHVYFLQLENHFPCIFSSLEMKTMSHVSFAASLVDVGLSPLADAGPAANKKLNTFLHLCLHHSLLRQFKTDKYKYYSC